MVGGRRNYVSAITPHIDSWTNFAYTVANGPAVSRKVKVPTAAPSLNAATLVDGWVAHFQPAKCLDAILVWLDVDVDNIDA